MSVSLVRAVEQGRVPASPAFVSACARALGVGVAELLGQPYLRTNRTEHQVHACIPRIRRELAAYGMQPLADVPPRELDDLARDVAQASALRHSVNLAQLGAQLPGLLAELRAAVYTLSGSKRERAFGLLAESYAAAGQVAYKLGYIDLVMLRLGPPSVVAELGSERDDRCFGDKSGLGLYVRSRARSCYDAVRAVLRCHAPTFPDSIPGRSSPVPGRTMAQLRSSISPLLRGHTERGNLSRAEIR